MKRLNGFLRLTRPANQITAITDVLAGVAIATFFFSHTQLSTYLVEIVYLCLSTVCLYGGGVVFNDVFDLEIDRYERPERALPSGLIKTYEAVILGFILFITGVILAFLNNQISGIISLSIVLFALVYDKWAKHNVLLGPLNMGMCRCLNLMLGVSILPAAIQHFWILGIVPIAYIASITLISRGEVNGGKATILYIGSILYCFVVFFFLIFILKISKIYWSIILLIFFSIVIFKPLIKAIINPLALNIRLAVKTGILSLIILNAIWAAAVSQWLIMIVIVILLPVSILLSKAFAVT